MGGLRYRWSCPLHGAGDRWALWYLLVAELYIIDASFLIGLAFLGDSRAATAQQMGGPVPTSGA